MILGRSAIWGLLSVLVVQAASVDAMDYGGLLGKRRGGEIIYAPHGPDVLSGALDPAARKWYVPQVLFQEYQWRQWEYANYAETYHRRYVSTTMGGDYFYDLYGNFLGQGWLIFDWYQTQPGRYGNSMWKDSNYRSYFSHLVIAGDSKGQSYARLMLGDRIRTTLTPMTFSKPAFNGIQMDLASGPFAATFLLSRIAFPILGVTTRTPIQRTDNTHLMGGRATVSIGNFEIGGTWVNSHQSQTLSDAFEANPFLGLLTTDQNQDITFIEVRLRDDSPEDSEGGAAFFPEGSDIEITDFFGETVSGREIDFFPSIDGGIRRGKFLAADGGETILVRWNFEDPSYTGPPISNIVNVRLRLQVADDYRIEVTSNRQNNAKFQPVFLLMARAEGNVKDGSNARMVEFDYGLPTGNQIFGFTLQTNDLWGFNLYAEVDINHRFRQYANRLVPIGHHTVVSGLVGDPTAEAWMVNLSRRSYPWFFMGEWFGMDDAYTTHTFLSNAAGALDYEDEMLGRYEFVDDNDDQDQYPDWARVFQAPTSGISDAAVFPGFDENNDFISDFNQNDTARRPNWSPDYEEPFLRYRVDHPEYLFGMDLNNNIWVDRFENDEVADFPYKRDHFGYNIYFGTHIQPDARVIVGQLRERLKAGGRANLTTYGLFLMDRDLPGIGRMRVFDMVKRVKDNIPDDLFQWIQPPFSRGMQRRVSDPMRARNTWINTLWIGLERTGISGIGMTHKLKYEFYRQMDSDELLAARGQPRFDRFLGIVNGVDYTFSKGRFGMSPRLKSEFRHQSFDLLTREKRKEWSGTASLLVTFPLLGRAGVQAGLEAMRFNDMLDDSQDFTGVVSAAQLSITTSFEGYLLITQIGVSFDRKTPRDGGTEVGGRSFVTIFAGLED